MTNLQALTAFVADLRDETALLAVAGVMLGFYIIVKGVTLVVDFVRRA